MLKTEDLNKVFTRALQDNFKFKPDVILTTNTLLSKFQEQMRTKTLCEIGNYIKHELDGKIWWERKRSLGGYKYFPRSDGGYTTFYYSTKAMRRLGYPPIMDQVNWDRLFER